MADFINDMPISQALHPKSSILGVQRPGSMKQKISMFLTLLVTCLCVEIVGSLSLEYTIDEEKPGDTSLADILSDSGLTERYNSTISAQLEFSILDGEYKKHFKIDNNHLLTTDIPLDRDIICPKAESCTITVRLAVSKPIQLFEVIKTHITILDLNDNHPVFPELHIMIPIPENTNPGVPFILPVATDPDSGEFGSMRYELMSASSTFRLQVSEDIQGSSEVNLILDGPVDREVQPEYSIELRAHDGGTPSLSGTLAITVTITDTNDNYPVFDLPLYNASIPENYPLSTPIVKVHATDRDEGNNGLIQYSFSRQTVSAHGDTFSIDPNTGDIFLVNSLDYETHNSFHLAVIARDQGHGSVPANTRVLIEVTDVNDFRPQMTVNVLTSTGKAEIRENQAAGEFVAHVSVEDKDGGPSGDVSCNVTDSQFFKIIEIFPKEFKVLTNDIFDRETSDTVSFTIECIDKGRLPLSNRETIEVTVLDRNDNTPIFSQGNYTTSVRENSSFPAPIFYVAAKDEDIGPNAQITYSMDSATYLMVDPTSGMVSTNAKLDREQTEEFIVRVFAVDQGQPPRTGTATIKVIVDDINDEGPVFSQQTYVFGTFENQPSGTEIGSVISTDADTEQFQDTVYTLIEGSEGTQTFRVDAKDGRISTKQILDREEIDVYVVYVLATNTKHPYLSSTATVSIHVADKNDNAPVITYPSKHNNTVHLSAYAKRGTHVSQITAKDADIGDNSLLAYQIAEGNIDELFTMNPASGEIFLEKTLTGSEDSDITLRIVVQDLGTPKKSSVAILTVILNMTIGAPPIGKNNHGSVQNGQTGTSSKGGLSMDITIVIIVGCLSVVLSGCLAGLLVYLCRRNKRPDPKKHHEAVHMQTDDMRYSGVRRAPEDGMEEIPAIQLTPLTDDSDLLTPMSDQHRLDMWITDDKHRLDDHIHLDSGHGSWAESGSETGTLSLEYPSSTGQRGYFRRAGHPEGQEHNYRSPVEMYGTIPPGYQEGRQIPHSSYQGQFDSFNRHLLPSYSQIFHPVPASTQEQPGIHQSVGGHTSRPPVPPRRTPATNMAPDVIQTLPRNQSPTVCYSMDDLLKFSTNKINVIKNQISESESGSQSSRQSSFNSNSGLMPIQDDSTRIDNLIPVIAGTGPTSGFSSIIDTNSNPLESATATVAEQNSDNRQENTSQTNVDSINDANQSIIETHFNDNDTIDTGDSVC